MYCMRGSLVPSMCVDTRSGYILKLCVCVHARITLFKYINIYIQTTLTYINQLIN